MQMEEKKTEQKIYVFQSLNIQGEKNPFKKTSFTINDTGDQLRSMACNLGKRTYVLMHDNSLASHPPCTSLSLSLCLVTIFLQSDTFPYLFFSSSSLFFAWLYSFLSLLQVIITPCLDLPSFRCSSVPHSAWQYVGFSH